MKKEVKKAISLVFRNGGKVLVLKRALSKESFPGAWSIPSTYIHSDETPQETADRLVKRKLGLPGVTLEPEPLGVSPLVDRGNYDFVMTDYEVAAYAGELAFDPQEYTAMRWVTPGELFKLIQTENDGAMGECTRTLLTAEKII